jgi:hypothetical protein
MKKFNIGNVRVTQTSEISLTLDSVGIDMQGFLERIVLAKTASELLHKEEYKKFIIYYDGCCKYNIQ